MAGELGAAGGNAIQQSLQRAGFIVADVRTLDKKQGTFKQINTTSAVKQDLVISAYKPNAEFDKELVFFSAKFCKNSEFAGIKPAKEL